jgi:hypothetical protein
MASAFEFLGVDGANPSRIAAVDFDVFSGDDVEGSQQKIRDSMQSKLLIQ